MIEHVSMLQLNHHHFCLCWGMYSISAWFWSKTAGDLPIDIIGPFIGSSLIFVMTGVGKNVESHLGQPTNKVKREHREMWQKMAFSVVCSFCRINNSPFFFSISLCLEMKDGFRWGTWCLSCSLAWLQSSATLGVTLRVQQEDVQNMLSRYFCSQSSPSWSSTDAWLHWLHWLQLSIQIQLMLLGSRIHDDDGGDSHLLQMDWICGTLQAHLFRDSCPATCDKWKPVSVCSWTFFFWKNPTIFMMFIYIIYVDGWEASQHFLVFSGWWWQFGRLAPWSVAWHLDILTSSHKSPSIQPVDFQNSTSEGPAEGPCPFRTGEDVLRIRGGWAISRHVTVFKKWHGFFW